MSLELATSVVKKLFHAGFIAYFAGGWVRDHLLGCSSEEIDIATNATPQHICNLFPKTILVGAQFGVVIVVVKGKNFEVTTFRKDHAYLDGRHPESVDFSSPEKDAERRDFTINGMFYDPLTQTIYDYVGGKADLEKKLIRAIGDPYKRFEEDKLRLMRAIRFAYHLGFTIEENTKKAITTFAPFLFPSVSIERIWQEFVKMSRNAHFGDALLTMHECSLLQTIFPQLKEVPYHEIKKRISFFPYFPLTTPTIAYLWELFPETSLEEKIALCHYLKITKQDIKLAHFFSHAESLFQKKEVSPAEWAHFYAHLHADLFLEMRGAKMKNKDSFFSFHDVQKKNLEFHIHWIKENKPLIRAFHLKNEGIEPGVKMGILLLEAQKITINHDLRDPEEIIKKLKQSPLWQES